MIDIHTLRENSEPVRVSQRARDGDVELIDHILEADTFRHTSLQEFESLRASQRETSKSVGKALKEERPVILVKARELTKQVEVLEARVNEADAEVDRLARLLSNLVLDGAPVGSEEDFVVLRYESPAIRDFAAEGSGPADYLTIGEGLDATDTKYGAKVSGARFYYLKGIGARLELVLMAMALDQALAAGSVPMMTPTLVTPQVMGGTGFLNERSGEIYYPPAGDLYPTGISEVTFAGYHSDEIFDLSAGSKRYLDWSTCYRHEAGSAGKDMRGIIRVHQFNKAEVFFYCRPEKVTEEHERSLAWEEEMLHKVELPYRVIDMAVGDPGTSTARKFDCETRLPTQPRYMEVISTSNCTTFQVRRLGVHERREDGMFPVTILNGILATTRQLVAILESHQLADGSLRVPEALRPYLGGLKVLEPIE